jgi:hypothetical protein
MRIPGQHLSHHPLIANETTALADDPMRPYRVHELLTRHTQGKRRGQAGEDLPLGDGPAGDAGPDPSSGAPVPGAPGGVQEDGR